MGEKKEVRVAGVKNRNRVKLLDFLGNPENDWPTREKYSTQVLGYQKSNQIYHFWTPTEITEIELEAIEIRKKRTAGQRARTLQSLYRKAIGYNCPDTKFFKTADDDIISQSYTKHYPPDPAAAREFLDRTEGKVPAKLEHSGTYELSDLTDEQLDKRIQLLLAKLKAGDHTDAG